MKDIVKLGIFLAVVSALAAGVLALTYNVTNLKIAENKEKGVQAALKQILSEADEFQKIEGAFVAKQKGAEIGRIYSVSPKGYGGAVEMMVGVFKNGEVAGIKIIGHSETPGLGSKVSDPQFLSQFINKSLQYPLQPKKDIKAITGATITTKAVSTGVREALERDRNSN